MKIRIGFVSNSSSSSFIIVGRAITYNELVHNKFEHPLWAVGYYLNEGRDVFKLDDEMIKRIKASANRFKNDLEFYEVLAAGASNVPVPSITNGGSWVIDSFEADVYSTGDIDEFISRYLEGDDA